MANITVLVAVSQTPAPAGAAPFPAGTNPNGALTLTVTDSANAVQTATLNGTEATPWQAGFQNLASGAGTVSAQSVDGAGAPLGTALPQAFSTAVATPATFPQPTSITVTAA